MFIKKSTFSVGFILLIVLGILHPVGHIFKLNLVSSLAVVSTASPFAEVFTGKLNGFEYWATHATITATDRLGQPHRWTTYPGSLNQMGEHHLTQIFHGIPMIFSYLEPQISFLLIRPMFCRPDSLFLKLKGIEGTEISHFDIEIKPRSPSQPTKTLRFSCK